MVEPPEGPWIDPLAEQRVAAEKLAEWDTKLLTAMHEKGAAYTNLVIAAGYAMFFGLWTIAKPFLSKAATQWAALLMLSSATVFVLFEIYKMYKTSEDLHARQLRLKQMIQGKQPVEILEMYERTSLEAQRAALDLIPIWRVALGVTAVTGVAAVGILAAALVIGLFKGAA